MTGEEAAFGKLCVEKYKHDNGVNIDVKSGGK
jgi:hypothetical protein